MLLASILAHTVSKHCDTSSSLSSCAQLDYSCVCACSSVGSTIMVVEFAVFLPPTKSFNVLAT